MQIISKIRTKRKLKTFFFEEFVRLYGDINISHNMTFKSQTGEIFSLDINSFVSEKIYHKIMFYTTWANNIIINEIRKEWVYTQLRLTEEKAKTESEIENVN